MAQTGYMTLASAVDDLARSGFREHFRMKAGRLLGLESGTAFDPAELVIRSYHRFEGVPIRRSVSHGATQAALPRLVFRPVREPFVFGPRDHPTAVGALAAATPRTWRYDYGFPAPAFGDPWQDDGGED